MPILSSIFLVAALILAVVIGPQTRPWSWGPAMLALAISVLAALPVIWKRGKSPADIGLLALGTLTIAWFAWRAWISPVVDFGQADLLLLACTVGTFLSIRAIAGNAAAERILIWGIALLMLANLVVIGKQINDPAFSPVFRTRATDEMVSGFFAHYNETANYLIASSMLVGAAALFGRHATATKVIWVLIALAGLAGVWFTRSRGGILGAAVACGILTAIALTLGKKSGARWFAPALIALPVLGLGIGAFLFMGWQEAQELRQAGSGMGELLDNDCRLYFLGIALSCIASHPLVGGGSRSFGWECFRFWDKDSQGAGTSRPELVHNELIQAATDYGLVGAGLLMGLLGAFTLAAILRILFEEDSKSADSRDVWRLGALAALAGMFVQSCFSFVFHLLPGILLLGICLGMMSRSVERATGVKTVGTRILLTIAALFCVILFVPAGWKGSQVTSMLWPSYFSKVAVSSDETKIDALTRAIEIWPQTALYQDRAFLLQSLAASGEESGSSEMAERAIADYQAASARHPFDPGLAINRANLLSLLQRDSEAEEWYDKAIQLQGGMEAGFRGHFSFAIHLFQKGRRLIQNGDKTSALDTLERAATHIESAVTETPAWVIHLKGRELRISIHETLGTLREAAGNREGALQAYDLATTIPTGYRIHYRAAVLIGKMGVDAWSKRRPSEALTHFIEARKQVDLARGELPQEFTPSQRAEYTTFLDSRIAFLKGAKVEPIK